LGYIKIPELKSDCRHIMLLDGLTQLSVLPSVTTIGTRLQSHYPPKLLRQPSLFHTGTIKLIQEHGSQSSWLLLFSSICVDNSMLATRPFYSTDIFSCAVKYYGEAEFWFALIKVTTVRKTMSIVLVTQHSMNSPSWADRWSYSPWHCS
jgi:hypothetical protein